MIGDHQRIKGYSLFLCKEHATELHFLKPDFRDRFLHEMAIVAEAVYNACKPDKLNYELLGAGSGGHMHWHLFPRRKGDSINDKRRWVAAGFAGICRMPAKPAVRILLLSSVQTFGILST